jgi:hypothetical protein
MAKTTLNQDVLNKLRARIAEQQSGRVQRGISWPEWVDKEVNAYLDEVPELDRSGLVRQAVIEFLGLAEPAPKGAAAARAADNRMRYVPVDELMRPQAA